MAVGALDLPLVGVDIEPRRGDARVEPDVARQAELPIDVREVAPELVPRGKALGPIPVAPELLQRELVVRDVRVDARTRVAVPVPDAAEPGARLEQAHGEPALAEPI